MATCPRPQRVHQLRKTKEKNGHPPPPRLLALLSDSPISKQTLSEFLTRYSSLLYRTHDYMFQLYSPIWHRWVIQPLTPSDVPACIIRAPLILMHLPCTISSWPTSFCVAMETLHCRPEVQEPSVSGLSCVPRPEGFSRNCRCNKLRRQPKQQRRRYTCSRFVRFPSQAQFS